MTRYEIEDWRFMDPIINLKKSLNVINQSFFYHVIKYPKGCWILWTKFKDVICTN